MGLAKESFRSAEKVNKDELGFDELQSTDGIFWARLLLREGRLKESAEISRANLRVCIRNDWIDDIARSSVVLGEIGLVDPRLANPSVYIERALVLAHKSSNRVAFVESHLARARLRLKEDRIEDGCLDAMEALKVSNQSDFVLYEVDSRIVLGMLLSRANRLTEAHWHIQQSLAVSRRCSYALGIKDAEIALLYIKGRNSTIA
jgi:hypothetical protein